MANISDSIRAFIKEQGISARALEQAIGCSNGVISRCISKGTDISSQWVSKIIEIYPHLNPTWLLLGEGDMFRNSFEKSAPESKTDNEDYNKKSPIKPQQCNDYENIFNKSRTPNSIPLVSVKAVGGFAGTDFLINENDIEGYYVIPKFRNLNVDFLIEISGDSMMPRFYPGDIIACSIVHNSRFIQWNKPYLIATREDGMIVKRIKPSTEPDSILAVSDNAEYDPFDIPKSDIDGLARVVGVIHAE